MTAAEYREIAKGLVIESPARIALAGLAFAFMSGIMWAIGITLFVPLASCVAAASFGIAGILIIAINIAEHLADWKEKEGK